MSRQTVHRWLRRYADEGVVGLVDRSPVPASCPHQMPAVVEARIIEMRHDHPGWGPRTIGHQLGREGFDPVPAKTSIYRALVRHGGGGLTSSPLGTGVVDLPAVLAAATAAEWHIVELEGMDDDTLWPALATSAQFLVDNGLSASAKRQ